MEPAAKRAKLTDHFRVALKPRDVNANQKSLKKGADLKKSEFNFGKENIEVITLLDDDDEQQQQQCKKQQQQTQNSQLQSLLQPLDRRLPAPIAGTTTTFKPLQPKETNTSTTRTETADTQLKLIPKQHLPVNKYLPPPGLSAAIVDHDASVQDDIRCEPYYAWDSFEYDREQELRFRSCNYLDDGKLDHHITPHKRAELVDWLVQLQNMYELDHEPLYMAVKLVDQYLMRKVVPNDKLQLLYITSILISAKFDERLPPVSIQDLIHATRVKFGIRYCKQQVISLEVDILNTLNFDIRFPLSYGFLRRFSRCTRSDKKTLNLARYILESSMLEHDMIEILESKMAAGSLLLAFQMLHLDGAWNETATFYTGYELEELYPLSVKLNEMITRLSKKNSAIRRKYSHEYFMEVARIPPIQSLAPDHKVRFQF